MRRLPQQLLSLCLTGVLLLRLCRSEDAEYEYEYNYDTTATPDYDYNATFEYYYSNTSDPNYEVYEIIHPRNKDTEEEPKKGNMAPETAPSSLLLIMSWSIHHLYQLQ